METTTSEPSMAMEGFYKVLSRIYQVLSHPDRLRMLMMLSTKEKSYSELMFGLRANPRMVSWHLNVLKEYGFVKQKEGYYEITPLGQLLVDSNIEGMVQLTEKALREGSFEK